VTEEEIGEKEKTMVVAMLMRMIVTTIHSIIQ
jgi:hypothetical protein